MDIKKIPNDIIENFEKHYKENVIQPTNYVNSLGEIKSYIYSNQCKLTEKNYEKRVFNGISENGHNYSTAKYGIVYMEIPNNKQIRYDYVFYDYKQVKKITTFAHVIDECCVNNGWYFYDYDVCVNDVKNLCDK